MGLSFTQFEREVTAERIRDKIAASKKKGLWMGGLMPLGYHKGDDGLVINQPEAEIVRRLFEAYIEFGNVRELKQYADRNGFLRHMYRPSASVWRRRRWKGSLIWGISPGIVGTISRSQIYLKMARLRGGEEGIRTLDTRERIRP